MSSKVIEFIYDKTLERAKNCRTTYLYYICQIEYDCSQESLKKLIIKLSVRLLEQIMACKLSPSFCENGFKLETCQYISADNNSSGK